LEDHSKLRGWLQQFPTEFRLDRFGVDEKIATQEEQVRLMKDNAQRLVKDLENKLDEENQMGLVLNNLELKLVLTEPEIESVGRKLRIAKSQNELTNLSDEIEVN
jgi:hypothetical protein